MSVKYIRPDNLITDRKTTKLVKRKKFIQEDEYEMKILLDILGKAKESIRQNREFFK